MNLSGDIANRLLRETLRVGKPTGEALGRPDDIYSQGAQPVRGKPETDRLSKITGFGFGALRVGCGYPGDCAAQPRAKRLGGETVQRGQTEPLVHSARRAMH